MTVSELPHMFIAQLFKKANGAHSDQTAYCTARQCLPLRRKFMECSINSPALSLLMKHLVIG